MANKLPKVKNVYIELACRLWCNALWCQLSGKDDLSVSDYVDIDFPLMIAEAKCQQFAFISSFPISHFLVPTFRVTQHGYTCKRDDMWRLCHGSRGKIHQAFSLRFCILQAIKNWSWGRPGNEAKLAARPSSCTKILRSTCSSQLSH